MTKLRILRWEILQDYLAGFNVIISLKMEAGGGSEEREREQKREREVTTKVEITLIQKPKDANIL